MHRDGAGFLIRINIVQHQRLNVTIKNNSHQFAVAIYDRASGIAANDVGGADKIKRRGKIELRFTLVPDCRQFEGILVFMRRSVFESAAQGSGPGNFLALLRVALGFAKSEAQREGGVRIDA